MNREEKQRIQTLADGVRGRARAAYRDQIRIRKPDLPFPYGAPPTPRSVETLPVEKKTGANFDTEWARRPSARVARAAIVEGLMRPTVSLLARPSREGMDRLHGLDNKQAVIFVANHHSHIDTPLILTSLPEPWRSKTVIGGAADYFFSNRVSGAASALALNAIPIERERTTRRSTNEATDLIQDGWSLLIFPEGGRSNDGWGQPFRAGAAYLAQRCDVPIVPIHVTGSGQILSKGRSLPKPASTTVNFGSPLRSEPDESSRRFSARVEAAVEALADETTTDWWQARQRAHSTDSPTLQGPEVSAWRRQWALGDKSRSTQRRVKRWPFVS